MAEKYILSHLNQKLLFYTKTMTSIPFLSVNDRTISLSEAIAYLRSSGQLSSFLAGILRQYILEQELKEVNQIQVDEASIEQAIINFRISRQLLDPQDWEQWLASNGMSYQDLRSSVTADLKLEKLKFQIAEPQLETYFQERKSLLDRVVLSRIILAERSLAENIKQQLLQDRNRFELLAREHSITSDRIANGMMGLVSRAQMPDILRATVDLARAGEILGPLEIDERYCIFRVEQFLPAALEGVLKQELQNQLFEQWLQEKLQKITVKLEVK
jgi:hypothetical protein